MAQFQVSPCTVSDINAMIYVYLQAFNNTFMNTILFPHQSYTQGSIRTWLYSRFKKQLTRGPDEMKIFKVTEVATGRLAAVARFGYPFKLTEEEQARRDEEKAQEKKALEEAEKETGKSAKYPEASNVEACEWYFNTLDEMREKYMKWDQDYNFQRRGLGAMLLGHVTELADAENRRIYLEATAAGHPLYEKLGFSDIDLITIDLKKWGEDVTDYNWVMMREPQTKL